jgi:hypothetical protein
MFKIQRIANICYMMHPIRAEQICALVAEQESGCASRTSNGHKAFYVALPGSEFNLQLTQPFQAGLNNSALRAVASQASHSRFFFGVLQVRIRRA